MPRVAVLTVAVPQQNRAPRLFGLAARVGSPLAHHAEADGTVRDDELLHEAADVVAVDGLLDDLARDDHAAARLAEPAPRGAVTGGTVELWAELRQCWAI